MVQSGCVRRAHGLQLGQFGQEHTSAEKKFPITEGATLLFRVEFFNMFNHPQFQIPATNTARQMQFTLRLSF
jgi:hypothetical protein